jgi:hypothetical protein
MIEVMRYYKASIPPPDRPRLAGAAREESFVELEERLAP